MKKTGLLLFLLVLFAGSHTFAANGDLGTSKGANGSESAPWLIEDFADFQAFCADSSKWDSGIHTRLEADIDLDPELPDRGIYCRARIAGDHENSSSFDGTPYAGHFDGNGHAISNLTVNGSSYCGLFGKTDPVSNISNLAVENCSISASSQYAGGLCGYNSGTISNCYATGLISGGYSSYNIGGLCGINYGTISNCYASGGISGNRSLGGLCGYNYSGTISNCYATGSVLGGNYSDYLGGFCGINSGTISNCYASGGVSGNRSLGGLCGRNNISGTIYNCYATGLVSGNGSLGGLCGFNNFGTISNCYYYIHGGPDNGYATPLNESQLQDSASFTGFDFTGNSSDGTDDIWSITPGYMPRLYWQDSPGFKKPLGNISTSLSGSGYINDPFIICNLDDIIEFRTNVSLRIGYYSLQNNIDLSETIYLDAFIPENFYGHFDGNGFTISNLSIDGSDYLGLFATFSGSVSNLNIDNINIISSGDYLGGLCGRNYSGTISNCYATGSISGGSDSDYLGGLCGFNDGGTISNCYATGSVSGYYYLGGLCGRNYSGTISNCYATGSVSGGNDSRYLGGLCGYNEHGTISNCYATGLVSGNGSLGGLCGRNYSGTISNCYATGSVLGGNDSRYLGGLCGYNDSGTISNCYASGGVSGYRYLGGLCGYNFFGPILNCYATGSVLGGNDSDYLGGLCGFKSGTISNSFWDTQTSGMTDPEAGLPDTDGIIGLTTAQMQTQSTFTDAGWDFVEESANGNADLWRMPYSMPGYPILSFQRDIPGDIAADYGVDMDDLNVLVDSWLNGYFMSDFASLAKNWLEGK